MIFNKTTFQSKETAAQQAKRLICMDRAGDFVAVFGEVNFEIESDEAEGRDAMQHSFAGARAVEVLARFLQNEQGDGVMFDPENMGITAHVDCDGILIPSVRREIARAVVRH